MGLLDLFRKKNRQDDPDEDGPIEESAPPQIYSGMRVEVATLSGYMLFIAKLVSPHDDTAELYQYSETTVSRETDVFRVQIRGYNDYEKKAVHMEGNISPGSEENTWHVTDLTILKLVNERAFFRLDIDIDASITTFTGSEDRDQPCKLVNISVGGVCISSEYEHSIDDNFILKVRLLEDRPPSAMYCRILRVTKKDDDTYEYGCQFVKLSETVQDQIAESIFTVQRRKRSTS